MPSFRKKADKAAADRVKLERLIARTRLLLETLEADLAIEVEREARYGKLAEAEGTQQIFHTRSQKSSTVVDEMNDTAKLNMSRSRSDDPFVKAIRAKGMTQNDLARKLKISVSLLSMYRGGQRKIPQERAEMVEKLTGWKADGKHWPKGVVSGD